AFALLIWSAACFVGYLRSSRIALLYGAVALLILAMYTKISVGYVAMVYLVILLQRYGRSLLTRKHHWVIAALSALLLLPLLVLTVKFGQANVQSATGVADAV